MLPQIIAPRLLQENRQLKAALGLREETRQRSPPGASSAPSFSSPRRFAIFSVGQRRLVWACRYARPKASSAGSSRPARPSRVLLVSDRASIVPARLLRGGQPVIAQGRGDGTIDVRPLEVGRNPFRPGDIIVTSGTGGL